MTAHDEIQGTGFGHSLAAQLGVLALAVAIVIALAWQYVW